MLKDALDIIASTNLPYESIDYQAAPAIGSACALDAAFLNYYHIDLDTLCYWSISCWGLTSRPIIKPEGQKHYYYVPKPK
jgi:hypothetical protein